MVSVDNDGNGYEPFIMRYLEKTFSVGLSSDNYRKNWDAVFGKEEAEKASDETVITTGASESVPTSGGEVS